LKTFAPLSTAKEISTPSFFRKEEKALAKAKRGLSKAEKGTRERMKRRQVMARVHERIRFRRENFTHQNGRSIVDRFGVSVIENMTVNRMVHHHCLATSRSDAAWSAFFSQLLAQAKKLDEWLSRSTLPTHPKHAVVVDIGKRCRSGSVYSIVLAVMVISIETSMLH
jgi:transposase